jgi:hypothetical protein
MTREELCLNVKKLNLPATMFSIEGKIAYGVNLDKYSNGTWRVFILDERGNYSMDESFRSENQANDYFYSLLVKLAGFSQYK